MKHPKYSKTFERGYINGVEIKNRIVMAPMGTNLENPDGSINDKIIEYYAARARGGAGIIIPGVISVDYPQGKAVAHQLRLDDIKYVPGMSRLAEAVQRYDARLILQLHHAGCSTMPAFTEGLQPVSSGPNADMTGSPARELGTEEVEKLIQKFITTAFYANMAGADGVELHAGHGYIISQFLSSVTNQRTDRYGGSLENRMRMLLEIIYGIKAACPAKFICGVRLAMEDTREGGSDIKERQEVCKALEKAGIHYISTTIGITRAGDTRTIESQKYPEGDRVYMAEAAKAVVDVPVFAVGKIREPSMVEGILAEGQADFVCLGRALLCDPEWVNKTAAGQEERIRHCISCLDGCISKVFESRELQCAVNPVLGMEYKLCESQKAPVSKKVVVVGGGVSGMEAARSAALSGHEVTLIEKGKALGGQLNLAKVPSNKAVLGKIARWYENELKILGVTVQLGTESTADGIERFTPDKVLLATGAVPTLGRIPTDVKLINSWDLLTGHAETPKRQTVAIIGGGIVGCEVAEYLTEFGNKVTIFEMLPAVANSLAMLNKIDLQVSFAVKGIDLKVSVTVQRVTEDGIQYISAEDGEQLFKADCYVSAIGQYSNRGTLAEDLAEKGIEARYIGDAYQVGKVINAVRAGFYAGKDL